jgi:hypothetical protein
MKKHNFPSYWQVNSQVDTPIGFYTYSAMDAAKLFVVQCLQGSDHDFGEVITCQNLKNKKKTTSFITRQFLKRYFPDIEYRIK